MAVVLGTNAGFVSEAPVADPGGLSTTHDNVARATKDTTAAGVTKITEIGWWCDNATPDVNFEVGLYSHHAGNDLPENLLYSDTTNAKGGAAGWKTAVVDWEVSSETIYWIAVQLDNTTPGTDIDYINIGGRTSLDIGITALKDVWVSDGVADYIMAIYAVVEAGVVYADLAGAGGGTGGGSGVLLTSDLVDLAGAGGGTGSGSAALTVSGFPSEGEGVSRTYKRVIAAGNDQIYYEDI